MPAYIIVNCYMVREHRVMLEERSPFLRSGAVGGRATVQFVAAVVAAAQGGLVEICHDFAAAAPVGEEVFHAASLWVAVGHPLSGKKNLPHAKDAEDAMMS